MAISKFTIAAVAAILAGGATAGLAGSDGPMVPAQSSNTVLTTPIAALAAPDRVLRDVPVEFTSGKRFGHVVAVSTGATGHAQRVRVSLDDMPSQAIWLDQGDLVYSRSHDVIVAHDVHAPAIAVADAR